MDEDCYPSQNEADETLVWKAQEVVKETEKAWGFKHGKDLVFLPKSVCELELNPEDKNLVDIHIPRWLVEKKDLEGEVE